MSEATCGNGGGMMGEVLRYAPGDVRLKLTVSAHLFSGLLVYIEPADQYIHTVRANSFVLFAFTPSGEMAT